MFQWHTSALGVVALWLSAVAAKIVLSSARDRAVPAVLVAEVLEDGIRVTGSGGGGQTSLGG